MPAITGNTYRSPVGRRTPMRHFSTSVAIHPPTSPPTSVLPSIRPTIPRVCAPGLSNHASSRLPTNAPTKIAVTSDSRSAPLNASPRRRRIHRNTPAATAYASTSKNTCGCTRQPPIGISTGKVMQRHPRLRLIFSRQKSRFAPLPRGRLSTKTWRCQMRCFVGSLAVWVFLVLLPTSAAAQAVIAGTVRDSSGAILPGVTVEASSPALIEKVRTAVSDSTGQYRIEDLRPGIYTVNFTLTGFSAFRREGIELTGSFTATINAEMKVGALEETVTVTGESPIVDVQSARRQTVLNNDVLKAIPTVRSYNALVAVVPGVVTNTNDVVSGTATTQFPIHGGRNNEGRMTIDGRSEEHTS